MSGLGYHGFVLTERLRKLCRTWNSKIKSEANYACLGKKSLVTIPG